MPQETEFLTSAFYFPKCSSQLHKIAPAIVIIERYSYMGDISCLL